MSHSNRTLEDLKKYHPLDYLQALEQAYEKAELNRRLHSAQAEIWHLKAQKLELQITRKDATIKQLREDLANFKFSLENARAESV